MKKDKETISKIVELEDEIQLKRKLIEIENRCLREQLDLIKKAARVDEHSAYALLNEYKNVWEFVRNISTSGNSLVIVLPKKGAKNKGLKAGTPVLVALKPLRFKES